MRSTIPLAPLLALACDASAPPPEPPTEPRGASASEDLSARPPDRGPVRGGETMRRMVQWPDAQRRDATTYAALDDASKAAVDAAPVPVLVPALDVALDQRRVMQGPEWAAFWGQREGVTVSLHASRMARVLPGVRPLPGPQTVREQEAFVSRNEGIWSASWIEHGVAYALELECAPPDAPPCDDETALLEIAEGLVYVGGRGEEVAR